MGISKSDWLAIIFGGAGLIIALIGLVQNWPKWGKWLSAVLLVICFAVVGVIYAYPEDDHVGDIKFVTDGNAVAQCVKITLKAPNIAGKTLWLANSKGQNPTGGWVFDKIEDRSSDADSDDSIWTKEITLGGPEDGGTPFTVYAFYVDDKESDFLDAVAPRVSSSSNLEKLIGADAVKKLQYFWMDSKLPAGAPDKPKRQTLTRRVSVSDSHC
jgi:hypothetical protein